MKYKYNFDDRKKSNKKKIIFVVVSIICAIVISSFLFRNSQNVIVNKIANTIISPIRYVSVNTKKWFENFSSNLQSKKNIMYENEQLHVKIYELEYQMLEQEKLLQENNSLKRMLNIKSEYQHFELLYGRIILREHDNWSKKFTINVGSNEGVKLNQAVISTSGLVGYISKVNEKTSVVTTILDPSTSVSVNIGTINEPAILRGDLTLKSENKLKLEYIQIDTTISIGDMLYTSGLGNTYPSSIPVGKITSISGDKNDINRTAIVEPAVNISEISEVAIIVY